MKKWVMGGVVGCFLLGLSTCDRTGPTVPRYLTDPSDQTEGAAGIVVSSSSGMYFVGETHAFTAVLTDGGGTIPITDGTWATDTPGVATVNDAGLVTIVGQGFANITCTRGSLTGSKQIWGRVDCRGSWSGTYSIRRCELWGDFRDSKFCETHGGSGLPIELVLTQAGEVLQGTVKLGGISIPFVAKPDIGGGLEMEGEFFSDPYVINVAVGCEWTPSGPKFGMMLYYYKGTRSGQAMLWCDISLSKTGAGQ